MKERFGLWVILENMSYLIQVNLVL
jgi:hypothetical protein